MAATDTRSADTVTPEGPGLAQRLLLAALALPGVQAVQADTPPERASISYKYLDYQDAQPGWYRIAVESHAVDIVLPLKDTWSVETSAVHDTVSGASPAWHSDRNGGAAMTDIRRAYDLKISRYFPLATVTAGIADSRESDYVSDAWFVQGAFSTPSKNTTLTVGVSGSNDLVDAPKVGVHKRDKDVYEGLLGVTQVLTPQDIAQFTFTWSDGTGDFSDPYKFRDRRPESKRAGTLLGRWNHHFRATGGTARLSYRYYDDSFDIHAHTATVEYAQPLPWAVTLTPFVRGYQQSSARFYLEADGSTSPTFDFVSAYQSQDQRLAAFGGMSLGVKASKYLTSDVMIDVRYEHYEQKSDWYLFGHGSRYIAPFYADIVQLGITAFF